MYFQDYLFTPQAITREQFDNLLRKYPKVTIWWEDGAREKEYLI